MISRNNYYRWCCRADTPPSGSRRRRSDRRAAHKFDRRAARVAVRRDLVS